MSVIEMNLQHVLNKKSLLNLALTHKTSSLTHNSRLEILGDKVLGKIKLFPI